jgi:hypothetical protein
MQAVHHSKRFAATVSQLEALRTMLWKYVESFQRAARMKEIQQRRVAGEKLIRANGPECRLDSAIENFTQMVDRAFARHVIAPEIKVTR